MVLPSPTGVQRRSPFAIIEIDSEDLRKLLHLQWPNSDNKALQKSVGEIPVWLLDFPQYTFVCLVQRFR